MMSTRKIIEIELPIVICMRETCEYHKQDDTCEYVLQSELEIGVKGTCLNYREREEYEEDSY